MKYKILILLAVFSIVINFFAAENWVKGPNDKWHVDYNTALAEAKQSGKQLLIFFGGSDWDSKSKRIVREVFHRKDFLEFADKSLVLLFIDTPANRTLPKEQLVHNKEIKEIFDVTSQLPIMVIVSPDGKKITKIKDYYGFNSYINTVKRIVKANVVPVKKNVPAVTNVEMSEAEVNTTDSEVNMTGWIPGPDDTWFINYNEAIAEAKKTNKKIYVLITGSDWCGWCVKLKQDVLNRNKFKKFAKQNLVLLYLDFPRKKLPVEQAQHNSTVRQFLKANGGYPSAIILDSNGKELGRIGGYMPEDGYISKLKNIIK